MQAQYKKRTKKKFNQRTLDALKLTIKEYEQQASA